MSTEGFIWALPPLARVEPTKENALNLPEVVVDEGVFVPLSPTEAAEGEGFMPLSPAEDAEVFFCGSDACCKLLPVIIVNCGEVERRRM